MDGLPTGVADYSWVKIRLEAIVSNEPTDLNLQSFFDWPKTSLSSTAVANRSKA